MGGFPGGSVVKNLSANADGMYSIPSLGDARGSRAMKLLCHAIQPVLWSLGTAFPKACEPVLCNKRSRRCEKPAYYH